MTLERLELIEALHPLLEDAVCQLFMMTGLELDFRIVSETEVYFHLNARTGGIRLKVIKEEIKGSGFMAKSTFREVLQANEVLDDGYNNPPCQVKEGKLLTYCAKVFLRRSDAPRTVRSLMCWLRLPGATSSIDEIRFTLNNVYRDLERELEKLEEQPVWLKKDGYTIMFTFKNKQCEIELDFENRQMIYRNGGEDTVHGFGGHYTKDKVPLNVNEIANFINKHVRY